MILNIHTQKSRDSNNRIDLSLESNGMTIIVKKGTMMFMGHEHEFKDDYKFDVDSSEEVEVRGMIVRDDTNGNFELMVDEIPLGESAINFEDIDYSLIHKLFITRVPKGTKTLDSVRARLIRILPVSEVV